MRYIALDCAYNLKEAASNWVQAQLIHSLPVIQISNLRPKYYGVEIYLYTDCLNFWAEETVYKIK